jgi:hypothetical protein
MCQKSINEREREQETERRKVEALERIACRLEQLNGTIAAPLDHIAERLDLVAVSIAGMRTELVNLTSVVFRQK